MSAVETSGAAELIAGIGDGGDVTTTVSDNAIINVANDYGVPEDLVKEFAAGDENFAALVHKGDEPNKSDGEDNAAGETPDEDSAAGSEPNEGAKPPADDKIPAGKSDDTPVEFADDVIKGIKGKEFEKLPDDVKVAIAEFYNESQAKAAKATEAETRINKLLEDPVVRARASAIEAGRAAELQVRGMTADEKQTVIGKINDYLGIADKDDRLSEGDAVEILSIIEKGIESIATDMAQDLSNRTVAVQDSQRRAQESARKGNELLLSLSEFNAGLAVKEKDVTKFYRLKDGYWVYNEAHPEIGKFKEGIGKISEWAQSNGIDSDKAVKMGAKAFYAAAAAALDMPVVFNAKERDKKIAAAVKEKALAPFLKSAASKTLNTQGTDSTVNREKAAALVIDGVDVERLVTDQGYFDDVVNRKFGDLDWLEKVNGFAAKGRAIINKKTGR